MRLYLVRHARPEEWSSGRCIGRTDVPLSEAGRQSAAKLAAGFAGIEVAAVYASPLRRAVATAEPIAAAAGREVTRCPGLVEVDFGTFEGRTYDEIAAADPAFYARWMASPATVRFPNGEGFTDVRGRALAAATAIARRHPDGAAVAVAHFGPIRALLGAALGLPDDEVFQLDVAHASVHPVEWPQG